MNYKYKYTSRLCLIFIFTFMCLVSSCTYDYFEDETNYIVYVPKADENKLSESGGTYLIDDVKILIYADPNTDLEKHTYTSVPALKDTRHKVGNFGYRIHPGNHKVFCFSNITSVDFKDTSLSSDAYFELIQSTETTETNAYNAPSRILLDKKEPFITYPGPVITDTAYFDHKYVGQICFALKNMETASPALTYDNIASVQIVATNVGTRQNFSSITDSINTRSTRNSINDKIILKTTLSKNLPQEFSDYSYAFGNYYFPSLDASLEGVTGEIPMEFALSFLDASGETIIKLTIPLVDDNYNPRVLHMNETIWIGIDGNKISIFTIGTPEEWDSNILSGNGNEPGAGGGGVIM